MADPKVFCPPPAAAETKRVSPARRDPQRAAPPGYRAFGRGGVWHRDTAGRWYR
ncbi:hypothetical protein JOD54_006422 [Actinokineospora baliensis]|uniref:hypothetical protein n=1 Tax=Actinokineospora baliensis TaxID=547056 RepID=UPI00195B59C2|nr:hypothetical protein [Actinokineospora baliensis]MBM7776218.1 hypothetical protein [Actinokineospora baliensis]